MTKEFKTLGDYSISQSALSLINSIFPDAYAVINLHDPSFAELGRVNIFPQISGGGFFAIPLSDRVRIGIELATFVNFPVDDLKGKYRHDYESALDHLRYENVIFFKYDLSIITIWEQAETAIMFLHKNFIDAYADWRSELELIIPDKAGNLFD